MNLDEHIETLKSDTNSIAWRIEQIEKAIESEKQMRRDVWLGNKRRFYFTRVDGKITVYDHLEQAKPCELKSIESAQRFCVGQDEYFRKFADGEFSGVIDVLQKIREIADTLQNSQWHDYTDTERESAWERNRSLAQDIFNLIEEA